MFKILRGGVIGNTPGSGPGNSGSSPDPAAKKPEGKFLRAFGFYVIHLRNIKAVDIKDEPINSLNTLLQFLDLLSESLFLAPQHLDKKSLSILYNMI